MAVTGSCDFPGKVLLLSDVSDLCSYFRHPMLFLCFSVKFEKTTLTLLVPVIFVISF